MANKSGQRPFQLDDLKRSAARTPPGANEPTGGPRGYANPAVQMAAQQARGVQNFTPWAEQGQGQTPPTQSKPKLY